MSGLTAANRRNLLALGAVGSVLAGAYVLVPHPLVQYGAWLVVFAVWMVWFMSVGIGYLRGK